MRTATELLIGYAAYHRDRRNISSHFVGVPLIVFASAVLLAHPSWAVRGLVVTPAWIVCAAMAAWYLTRGNLVLGLAVSLGVAMLTAVAQRFAADVASWLGWAVGLLALGWLIQFIGHWYEGKKPAFVDDVSGLLVGPMFIVAEALFTLGWNKPLLEQIEHRVGPPVLRDLAKIA